MRQPSSTRRGGVYWPKQPILCGPQRRRALVGPIRGRNTGKCGGNIGEGNFPAQGFLGQVSGRKWQQ